MSQEFHSGRRLPPPVFTEMQGAQYRVAMAPGIGFAEHGGIHLLIALVEGTHRLCQALCDIRRLLVTDIARPTLFELGEVAA